VGGSSLYTHPCIGCACVYLCAPMIARLLKFSRDENLNAGGGQVSSVDFGLSSLYIPDHHREIVVKGRHWSNL
jgi:hypothetical protein